MSKSKVKPAPLNPDTVVGEYRIVQKLAAGGFGVVYLALDANNREVAIKEYLPAAMVTRATGESVPQIAPDKLSLYRMGLRSFFEEGRSLAQISHPSIVSVQNFFRENETVYMVMNYLRGATLQEFILTAKKQKNTKLFRESTIRSLFDEILQGLRLVHQHKMLHLDIKPANIYIEDSDRAVLIDFGAAREVINKGVDFLRPMYTPGFAAPELYTKSANFGPWSDVYAVGACMFSCMIGAPPPDALTRRTKDTLDDQLISLEKMYSAEMLDLTAWCMKLDPTQRPQSVHELQRELMNDEKRNYQQTSILGRVFGSFKKLSK